MLATIACTRGVFSEVHIFLPMPKKKMSMLVDCIDRARLLPRDELRSARKDATGEDTVNTPCRRSSKRPVRFLAALTHATALVLGLIGCSRPRTAPIDSLDASADAGSVASAA